VPDGVVLAPDASMLSEVELTQLVSEALAALGAQRSTPIAVRSSALAEDTADCSAAGVFRTERGVVGAEAVGAAVRRVLGSRYDERAVAYGARRGLGGDALAVAVLLQRDLAPPTAAPPTDQGPRHGVCFSRDPSDSSSPWLRVELGPDERALTWLVDRGTRAVAMPPQQPEGGGQPLTAEELRRVADLALGLEAELGAPVDIEWLLTPDRPEPWLLQVRPITAFDSAPQFPLSPGDLGPEPWVAEVTWQLDAEHNPEPLSPAQAGLVAWVDARARTGVVQRVVHGYLYWTRDHAVGPPVRLALAEIVPYFDGVLSPRVHALLSPFEGPDAHLVCPPLPQALSVYAEVYELRSSVAAAVREARAQASARGLRLSSVAPTLAPMPTSPPTSDTSPRDGHLNALLRQYGAFAPQWDVLAPTYDEHVNGTPVSDHGARLLPRGWPSVARRDPTAALLLDALAIGELDDGILARIQRLVRRVLLALARRWGDGGLSTPEDIFFLPLDELATRWATSATPPPDGRELAALGRRRWHEQRRRVPPTRIRGAVLEWERRVLDPARTVLRGVGLGGRARGRALLAERAAEPGEIPIRRTLLPSDVLLLGSPAALVTEQGGALSHGAILARERSIPAVVGVRGARTVITEGAQLVVDGVAGEVYLV
jgi:pyruvate,water dikinase